MGAAVHVVAYEFGGFFEHVLFLLCSFGIFVYLGGGVKVGEDKGGGSGEGQFGVRFSAGEFEVFFDLAGGGGGGRERFGDGV